MRFNLPSVTDLEDLPEGMAPDTVIASDPSGHAQAMELLMRHGNLRVPGGRYGYNTETCAEIAWVLSQCMQAATGEDITAEKLEFDMGLVVNGHDDVAYAILSYGRELGIDPAEWLDESDLYPGTLYEEGDAMVWVLDEHTLQMEHTGRYDENMRPIIHYRFDTDGEVIFQGEDFRPSAFDAWDSYTSVLGLLGFLTLLPGDTDAEYFADYTPEQMEWAEEYAEGLSVLLYNYQH